MPVRLPPGPDSFINTQAIPDPAPQRAIQPVGTAASIYRANTGPAAQQLSLRQRMVQSGRGILDLSNPFSPQNMAVYNANQGVFDANDAVYNAQGGQSTANRAVNANEFQNIGMRQGNFERILAASNDIADKSAVAQYREHLAGRDRRNQMFGVAPEQRIEVWDPGNGFQLPSGQVAAPISNEDRVTRSTGIEEKRAGFLTDILKNKASAAGLDVDDARVSASRAGNAASRVKAETGRYKDYAEYEDALLDNEMEMLKLPPFPGAVMWQDPETGESEWVTAAEREQRRYSYAQALDEQRYGNEQAIETRRKEQEKIEQKQRETGGSPLAAISDAQLMDQYSNITPPGATVTPQAIRQELIRRYMAQGYSRAQAEQAADFLIGAEMEQRRQQANRASGGGGQQMPTPTIPPARGTAGR